MFRLWRERERKRVRVFFSLEEEEEASRLWRERERMNRWNSGHSHAVTYWQHKLMEFCHGHVLCSQLRWICVQCSHAPISQPCEEEAKAHAFCKQSELVPSSTTRYHTAEWSCSNEECMWTVPAPMLHYTWINLLWSHSLSNGLNQVFENGKRTEGMQSRDLPELNKEPWLMNLSIMRIFYLSLERLQHAPTSLSASSSPVLCNYAPFCVSCETRCRGLLKLLMAPEASLVGQTQKICHKLY